MHWILYNGGKTTKIPLVDDIEITRSAMAEVQHLCNVCLYL